MPASPVIEANLNLQVSCLAAVTPMIYAWQAQNTGGDTKKKCTSAMGKMSVCSCKSIYAHDSSSV